MNISNRYGIWISDKAQLDKISNIRQYFTDIDDIFLVSDEDISCADYGLIPCFYVQFQSCGIIFLSVDDLIENKESLGDRNIYLCDTIDNITKTHIDKSVLKNIKVIEL